MENSNNKEPVDIKLQIAFPKSSEDNRLQLVEINGSIFAIVHCPLESNGPIHLHCEEWSLVLLAPIKSKENIEISAINVICLNEIDSEEGMINIHATNRLVKFAHKTPENAFEIGECGEFRFEDDPAVFLRYYRLFEHVANSVREENSDSFLEAQQKFLMSLCSLASKIEGKTENLDIRRVLEIWDIPHLQ